MTEIGWTQKWPRDYLDNPSIAKPIEEIWDDIDNYSWEEIYTKDEKLYKSYQMVVVVPPLKYKGKFIKGIFFSQVSKYLIERYPKLKDLFFVGANSMFSSYPHNHDADYFLACYKNEAHERYYKEKYPNAKHITCVPLQDADWLDETKFAPIPNTERMIDVFCVASPYPVKNLPIFAEALKIYEKKHGRRLRVVFALGQRKMTKRADGSLDYSETGDYVGNVLRKVDEVLGDTKQYIEFEPYIKYGELIKYYSAAKCCVLTALIEGKNRFISEAMACGAPIVVFKDFNKYIRGDYPVFLGNSGEYAPEFTAESLADTIHKIITNPKAYDPRKNYLRFAGRENFVNVMVDAKSYYRQNLPKYRTRGMFTNEWVDAACKENYQVSLRDFVYGKKIAWQHVSGKNIEAMTKRYYEMFDIK